VNIKNGQIALPFVLLLSGIILEIVVAGFLASYFSSSSGYGLKLYYRASSVAYTALNDVLMQISRNKDFGIENSNYGIMVGRDTASISIQTTIYSTFYFYEITVLGVAGSRQAKLIALLNVDRKTGLVKVQSIKEAPIE